MHPIFCELEGKLGCFDFGLHKLEFNLERSITLQSLTLVANLHPILRAQLLSMNSPYRFQCAQPLSMIAYPPIHHKKRTRICHWMSKWHVSCVGYLELGKVTINLSQYDIVNRLPDDVIHSSHQLHKPILSNES